MRMRSICHRPDYLHYLAAKIITDLARPLEFGVGNLKVEMESKLVGWLGSPQKFPGTNDGAPRPWVEG